MKSKTLSSDLTVFKKDITRFSPVWLIWCVMFLLRGYTLHTAGQDLTDRYEIFPTEFVIANMIYGFCCAVSLFGYLFDPKECITTHSLPIRREHLFLTHLLSGFAMHIVPSGLFFLAIAPMCHGNVFALFGYMVLQFVFFYGLGIFCVMLTGRKFAAAVMYGLINSISMLTFFAVTIVYMPMLKGIELMPNAFLRFCPPAAMMSKGELDVWQAGIDEAAYLQTIGIFAAVGVGLMLVSLVLYRRRKLECAENFMAYPALNYLFVLICTVFCGCFFTAFSSLFLYEGQWGMLGLGTVIGYFASMMVLKRSPRVFYRRSFAGLAALGILMAGSIFTVKADPLGLTSYVPNPDSVIFAEVSGYGRDSYFTEDPAQLQKITQLHEALIDQLSVAPSDHFERSDHVELTYHMKNGNTIRRSYDARGELIQEVKWYKCQPEYQFGVKSEAELLEKLHVIDLSVYHPKYDQPEEHYRLERKDQEALLQVIFDECRAGIWADYEYGGTGPEETVYSVDLLTEWEGREPYNNYMSHTIDIPKSAVKTIAWLEQYTQTHFQQTP